MVNNEQSAKTRAVIQGLLSLLTGATWRTELVKLVYLADYRFYESTNRTITGNTYKWDNYGPNAVGNAIVREADELVDSEKIQMNTQPSSYGGDVFIYRVENPKQLWQEVAAILDEGERQILMDVVKQYGQSSGKRLVAESKETRPFENASQFDNLNLEQNEKAKELRQRLNSSPEFLEEAEKALNEADEGQWIWDK